MKPGRLIPVGCVSLVLLLVAAAWGFGYVMSDATPYCPWHHKFNDLSSCQVLDEAHRRVLLQHADLDSNIYYLEIIEQNGESAYFEMPDVIGELAPGGYTAKLVHGSGNHIVLNGETITLRRLPKVPSNSTLQPTPTRTT